jgi:hypothetical protein
VTDHSHVSDLRWDRWLAGELSPDDTTKTLAHAESCVACGARMREITAGRDTFLLRPLEVSFTRSRPVRRARSTAFAGAAAIAVAVVVAIIVRRSPSPRDEGEGALKARAHVASESSERFKGNGPNLLLAAGRAPDLVPVSTGDVVYPGDSLQAAYTSDRDGFGAVLALDGGGTANSYVPARGDLTVGLPAGVDRSFPESTVLDRVVGTERVVILWCQTAQPIAPLLGELRATGDVVAPAGCHVRRVVLEKRLDIVQDDQDNMGPPREAP